MGKILVFDRREEQGGGEVDEGERGGEGSIYGLSLLLLINTWAVDLPNLGPYF